MTGVATCVVKAEATALRMSFMDREYSSCRPTSSRINQASASNRRLRTGFRYQSY